MLCGLRATRPSSTIIPRVTSSGEADDTEGTATEKRHDPVQCRYRHPLSHPQAIAWRRFSFSANSIYTSRARWTRARAKHVFWVSLLVVHLHRIVGAGPLGHQGLASRSRITRHGTQHAGRLHRPGEAGSELRDFQRPLTGGWTSGTSVPKRRKDDRVLDQAQQVPITGSWN